MLILVIGILTVPIIMAYQVYMVQLTLSNTRGHFATIQNAINNYVVLNNRYPVPASLIAVEGDPAYGMEGSISPPSCAAATWKTTTGMCLSPNGNVLVGTVPFQALQLNPRDTLDYWGQRIVYAVSMQQISSATYLSSGGGQINAKYWNRATPATPVVDDVRDGTGAVAGHDMILISFGNNGNGAFGANGVEGAPCDTTLTEGLNCQFTHEYFLYSYSGYTARSLAPNTQYYDDITNLQTDVPVDTWIRNRPTPDYLITSANRVGVNTKDPQEHLHVVGDVKALDKIRSDQLCDDAGQCFNPEIIAGTLSQMDCIAQATATLNPPAADAGPPVTKLANSRVDCGTAVTSASTPILTGNTALVFPASIARVACTGGTLMAGINAAGAPICLTP